eukprot:366522-Chlamydomonas_euryale.AAC.4
MDVDISSYRVDVTPPSTVLSAYRTVRQFRTYRPYSETLPALAGVLPASQPSEVPRGDREEDGLSSRVMRGGDNACMHAWLGHQCMHAADEQRKTMDTKSFDMRRRLFLLRSVER